MVLGTWALLRNPGVGLPGKDTHRPVRVLTSVLGQAPEGVLVQRPHPEGQIAAASTVDYDYLS
jgi:hypothetical protein